uniref:2'-5' RNA ligase family protein n=1 Tax=Saccharomonospora saliphila TaxID=369829 RepID=UPI00037C9AC2
MSPDGARARLFTAVVPSAEAITALRRELDRHPRVAGDGRLRWMTVRQWHVTLGFYGDDDPGAREAWVRARLAGLRAPVMRMRGAGSFPGVLWTGISGERLAEL